eukprot:430287-Pyramimonas_sp.AAC.1
MDANGRIDAEAAELPYVGTCPPHNKTDDSGRRLVDFATRFEIYLVNTLIGEKTSWTCTDGTVKHRTDYLGLSQQ